MFLREGREFMILMYYKSYFKADQIKLMIISTFFFQNTEIQTLRLMLI